MDRVTVTHTAERMSDAHEARAGRGGERPCVVHLDLDGAAHIFRLRGWPWREAVDPVYETGVPRALEVFDALGVRATFFVIAEDLADARKAALLKEIVARGHEIASHSVTHTPLRELDQAGKRRELVESRAILARELGVTAAGFRAPFFSIDAESLALAAEAGYTWDSSILPGREVPGLDAAFWRTSGVRTIPGVAGVVHAEAPSGNARRSGRAADRAGLLELTLPAYRPLPFPFHASYSLVLGFRYFDWGVSRHGAAPLVLLFHLIDFADALPASMLRGWGQRLYTLSHRSGASKGDACRRMLERVRRSFTLTDTQKLVKQATELEGELRG